MKLRILLLALLTGALLSYVACGEEDCDPAESDTCVCSNDDDTVVDDCEADDADDTCTCTEGDAAEPEAGEPEAGEPEAGEPEAGEPEVEVPAYRYALIEDLTSPVAGEFPGIDGDYIRLTKADGTVHYASGLIDSNIGVEGNSAADPNQIIGAPDANCDANSGAFTSLRLPPGHAVPDHPGRVGRAAADGRRTARA